MLIDKNEFLWLFRELKNIRKDKTKFVVLGMKMLWEKFLITCEIIILKNQYKLHFNPWTVFKG